MCELITLEATLKTRRVCEAELIILARVSHWNVLRVYKADWCNSLLLLNPKVYRHT
jgi:hypothetical protein